MQSSLLILNENLSNASGASRWRTFVEGLMDLLTKTLAAALFAGAFPRSLVRLMRFPRRLVIIARCIHSSPANRAVAPWLGLGWPGRGTCRRRDHRWRNRRLILTPTAMATLRYPAYGYGYGYPAYGYGYARYYSSAMPPPMAMATPRAIPMAMRRLIMAMRRATMVLAMHTPGIEPAFTFAGLGAGGEPQSGWPNRSRPTPRYLLRQNVFRWCGSVASANASVRPDCASR